MSNEANAHNFTNQVELWKDWNETTTRTGASILYGDREAYRNPLNLYKMRPDTFFYQWFNATGGAWAWMIGGMTNFEQFLEIQYQFIEAFMLASKEASRFIHEAIFSNLQISSRSDIARLEKVVATLEERVYTLEDALVSLADDYLKVGIDQAVEEQEEPLEQGNGSQENVDTLPTFPQRTEAPGNLTGYLERVEGKLDRLLAALEKLEASAYPGSARSLDENEAHQKTQNQGSGTQQVTDNGSEIRQE